MQEESSKIKKPDNYDGQNQTWHINVLPTEDVEEVSQLLSKNRDKIGDIVDIERRETWFNSLFSPFTDKIFDILWVKVIDPKFYAQMTDTLNKERQILELKASDNLDIKKAA